MSMLENKLENEMAKMTNMVKSTVSSLQTSVSKLTDQFERKFAQIEQKLNRIASDRGAFENINAKRSTSLFGQTLHGTSNVETGNPFSLGGISQTGETTYHHHLHNPTRVVFLLQTLTSNIMQETHNLQKLQGEIIAILK